MLSNFYIISFILVVLVLVLNTKDGFIVGGVDKKLHKTKLVTAKDKTRERLKKIPKKKIRATNIKSS